jgi:hypothetical protein
MSFFATDPPRISGFHRDDFVEESASESGTDKGVQTPTSEFIPVGMPPPAVHAYRLQEPKHPLVTFQRPPHVVACHRYHQGSKPLPPPRAPSTRLPACSTLPRYHVTSNDGDDNGWSGAHHRNSINGTAPRQAKASAGQLSVSFSKNLIESVKTLTPCETSDARDAVRPFNSCGVKSGDQTNLIEKATSSKGTNKSIQIQLILSDHCIKAFYILCK